MRPQGAPLQHACQCLWCTSKRLMRQSGHTRTKAQRLSRAPIDQHEVAKGLMHILGQANSSMCTLCRVVSFCKACDTKCHHLVQVLCVSIHSAMNAIKDSGSKQPFNPHSVAKGTCHGRSCTGPGRDIRSRAVAPRLGPTVTLTTKPWKSHHHQNALHHTHTV